MQEKNFWIWYNYFKLLKIIKKKTIKLKMMYLVQNFSLKINYFLFFMCFFFFKYHKTYPNYFKNIFWTFSDNLHNANN